MRVGRYKFNKKLSLATRIQGQVAEMCIRDRQRMVDELGAEGFAHVEEACVCGLEARGAVIATGGSVAMEDAAMEHLKDCLLYTSRCV